MATDAGVVQDLARARLTRLFHPPPFYCPIRRDAYAVAGTDIQTTPISGGPQWQRLLRTGVQSTPLIQTSLQTTFHLAD